MDWSRGAGRVDERSSTQVTVKSNIALIGFMGTGKTAVGQALARKLGKRLVEMDSLIEQKAGRSIPEIFREYGEIAFRELEIEVAKEVAAGTNQVIACGGGVVLNKINIDRLQKNAVIVYLAASPNVLLNRTLSDGDMRPLLKVQNRVSEIKELLKFRRPFYERAADMMINTSNLGIEAVAERIVKKLRADESFNC